MSMMTGPGRTPEVGETVATFKKYEGAQKAVSTLIAKEVPAKDIAIVGSALRSIEKVTGKLGWAQAAWQGAINGILIGLLFAAFIAIWAPESSMAMMGGVMLIGVAFGMLFRVFGYLAIRRRRDYASVIAVSADHYEVAVSAPHAQAARQALGTTKPRPHAVPSASDEPPRYGIRVVDGAPQDPAAGAEQTAPAEDDGPAPSEESTGPAAEQPQRD